METNQQGSNSDQLSQKSQKLHTIAKEANVILGVQRGIQSARHMRNLSALLCVVKVTSMVS